MAEVIIVWLALFRIVSWEWSLYLDGLRAQVDDDDEPPPGGRRSPLRWPSLLGHFLLLKPLIGDRILECA